MTHDWVSSASAERTCQAPPPAQLVEWADAGRIMRLCSRCRLALMTSARSRSQCPSPCPRCAYLNAVFRHSR